MTRALTTEDFITKARAKHKDKYDYSKTVYTRGPDKICIGCPDHGSYFQLASNHMHGQGCPKCGHAAVATHKRHSTKEFIAKARAAHGDTYDYSKVRYKDSYAEVIVVCPKHGDFQVTAGYHSRGYGYCPACQKERKHKRRPRQPPRTDAIQARFVRVHGSKYDYSSVHFTDMHVGVVIACTEHKKFKMTPQAHIAGNGCPRCGSAAAVGRARKFIERAIAVHGDKYEYDQVRYINATTKVTLSCPEHGTFKQTPSVHIVQKAGCPTCGRKRMARSKKFTTEYFIERAIAVHGDKYEYDQVRYTDSRNKVTIRCTKHGQYFDQVASCHLTGKGCPRCGDERVAKAHSLTRQEFLARATDVHGDSYCYDKTTAYNYVDKIVVTCELHGDFTQRVDVHLRGSGCRACAGILIGSATRATFEEFLERARKIHGDKYTYDEATYSGLGREVTITCPIHQTHSQVAGQHLKGSGCPLCGHELIAEKRRLTTTEFIRRAQEKYGDLFDYSKTKYRDLTKEVVVGCRTHGYFKRRAGSHLGGSGCPTCSSSVGECKVAHWLTTNQVEYVQEWRDHDCTAINKRASFDFWIPGHKVIVEYDGEPHFMPLSWLCGRKQTPRQARATLKKIQTSDHNKDAWAAANNCTMIRIRYDEDVAEVLHRKLRPILLGVQTSQATSCVDAKPAARPSLWPDRLPPGYAVG